MERGGNLELSEIAWPRAITMGQDTEIMSRYTLPKGTTTETITLSNPSIDTKGVLRCDMSFASDPVGFILIMQAFPETAGTPSSFDGGLRLERQDGMLVGNFLNIQLNSDWSGYTVTAKCGRTSTILVAGEPSPFTVDDAYMHISITFQSGTLIWDPKIKVIRPTS